MPIIYLRKSWRERERERASIQKKEGECVRERLHWVDSGKQSFTHWQNSFLFFYVVFCAYCIAYTFS